MNDEQMDALIETLESWGERADMPLSAIGSMHKAAKALTETRAELAELRKQLEAAESRLREIDAALPVAWLIDDGRNAPWFCESDFLAERYGGDAKPMILRPARWSKQEGV